jgi:two-component system invasion response regulator UvrY
MMKWILVVDDHPAVRQGIVRLIEGLEGDFSVVEAATGEAALAQVEERRFDLVILDLSMPGRGGLDVIQPIRTSRYSPRVLVMSMLAEETVGVRALRLGANGYVTKGATRGELLRAIGDVLQGGYYVSSGLAGQILSGAAADDGLHHTLSDREYRVMYLLAKGKVLGEIAYELDISSKTAGTYRARVLDKLGLDSTAAIVRYALKHGLIE